MAHGDLYAHNLLVNGQRDSLLSDFGAASFLPVDDPQRSAALQALDRHALAVLVDELAQHRDDPSALVPRRRTGGRAHQCRVRSPARRVSVPADQGC